MLSQRLAASLSGAMLNQADPEVVRSGAPAYLLLLDGLIDESPRDIELLLAGAQLYNAYAGGLVVENGRRQLLTARARELAQRALCLQYTELCDLESLPFDTLTTRVAQTGFPSLRTPYTVAISWAGWIQARSTDWNAVADLGKVEALLEAVVQRDPGYDRGRAQLYLGVMRTQLPAALGGEPARGRAHFEAALRYSRQRDLMAKVEYARRYARLVFDRTLHDRLLHEVLQADPEEPGLTLSNVLAQRLAAKLMQEEFF
ncbi:MAG: hypothetical protein KDI68_05405 [Gammaproteobacteria bacterium]|nr:hypothetical protein [Gammaproteobacteria bacterium]